MNIRRGIQPQGIQIPLKTPSTPPLQQSSLTIPREISASPKAAVHQVLRRFFGALKTPEAPGAPGAPGAPWSPLEAPGGPWRPLKAPGGPRWPGAWKAPTCMDLQTLIYTMAYNIYSDGFRVLGTRNWDLRWIMTRALLRDTRSFSYVYAFRLLVKCLWTPEGFSGSGCHTLNTILDLRQLTLGIGKLVNRCFADLEVYMPNDQS